MPFTKLGSEIWRDFAIDGNSSSGANKPNKANIRTWAGELEAATGVLSAKVVNTTYNLATASGTQDITGFGFNPTVAIINFCVGSGIGGYGVGYATSAAQGSSSIATDGQTSYRQTASSLFYTNAALSASQLGVVSFITDGIRITWTKTGSPTGTLGITVLGQK